MMDLLAHRLASEEAPLSPAAEQAVLGLAANFLTFKVGDAITVEVNHTVFIATGWAGLARGLADGRRQIVSLFLPGDPIRTHGHASGGKGGVVALSGVQASAVDMAASTPAGVGAELRDAVDRHRFRSEAYIYDHAMRLGICTAYERVGHLLLEVHERLEAVGRVNGDQFLMPLSQKGLADVLGISEMHMNRTLRQLRQDGLLEAGAGWLRLPKRDELATRICALR